MAVLPMLIQLHTLKKSQQKLFAEEALSSQCSLIALENSRGSKM